MTEMPREALVVVEHGDYDEVVDELRTLGVVTQLLPPRLVLVATAPEPGGVSRPGVAGVAWYDDDIPDDVVEGLGQEERLFVAAWRTRREHKARPDDGLPWDARGHLPPDRPPGHA